MLKKMFLRSKVRNFVDRIHGEGKNYSIILSVEDAYKVWDVIKKDRNTYLLVKSTKSCARTNGSECNFVQTKELQIAIPKNAIRETLTNEVMEYYPYVDTLQSFITI